MNYPTIKHLDEDDLLSARVDQRCLQINSMFSLKVFMTRSVAEFSIPVSDVCVAKEDYTV